MSPTMPISSASGTKMAGEIGPISGWSQRHSASQLVIRIVSMEMIGWKTARSSLLSIALRRSAFMT